MRQIHRKAMNPVGDSLVKLEAQLIVWKEIHLSSRSCTMPRESNDDEDISSCSSNTGLDFDDDDVWSEASDSDDDSVATTPSEAHRRLNETRANAAKLLEIEKTRLQEQKMLTAPLDSSVLNWKREKKS